MTETPPDQQPGEVPSDEDLDVEGPNESSQPSGAPGLEPEESGSADDD